MVYVQFEEYQTQQWNDGKRRLETCTPYLVDCMGSDGVFIIDGRNKLSTMINDCLERIERLKNVKQGIASFRIIKCDAIGRNEVTVYQHGTIC